MKEYFGRERCPYCQKTFKWKYIDDGYRSWMEGQYVTITSRAVDNTIAICTLNIDKGTGAMHFSTQCVHCYRTVSFPCSEDIAKELSS